MAFLPISAYAMTRATSDTRIVFCYLLTYLFTGKHTKWSEISEAGRKVMTKMAVTTNSIAAVLRLAIRYRSCSVSLAVAANDVLGPSTFCSLSALQTVFPALDVFLASVLSTVMFAVRSFTSLQNNVRQKRGKPLPTTLTNERRSLVQCYCQ